MRGALSFCSVGPFLGSGSASAGADAPLQLTLDTSECEQALRIVHKHSAHQDVTPGDWRQLFETVPYQWLKARESSMSRPFTDQEFEDFLLSTSSLAKENEWRQTLAELKRADMQALGRSVMVWLPDGATIRARVFPEIKPKTNSFVWTKSASGPAIFLYLERQTQAKFETRSRVNVITSDSLVWNGSRTRLKPAAPR